MTPSPELHSALLTAAAIVSVLLSALLVARSPRFTAPGLHALYGGTLAWWLFCMASLATAPTNEAAETWSRLAHLAVGTIPAIVFHLNAATAGLVKTLWLRVRVHYVVAAVVTLLCAASPWVLDEPKPYAWGTYFGYTAFGLVPLAFLVVTLAEVFWIYGRALRQATPGTAYHDTLREIHVGNLIAAAILIDYLPAFGFGVYPPGYLVLTGLQCANLWGSVSRRLVEITPEFAADSILRTMPEGVFAVDSRGVIRFANDAAARALGEPLQELVDRPIAQAIAEPALLAMLEGSARGEPARGELEIFRGEAPSRHLRIAEAPLVVKADQPLARVYVLQDVSEQRRAEAEAERLEGWVREGQKRETLGVMAGGIAHDFNNLLTVIVGGIEFARSELEKDHPAVESLDTVSAVAERAAELTAQMLTYAGRGSAQRRPLDLNTRCRDMAELMRSAVSKRARLVVELGDDLPPIVADESQVSQIVLNLLTNASEALGEEPGRIALRTGTLEASDPRAEGLDPESRWVFLEVSDTGDGMDAETRRRIFEPFYSTKFTGRGLGLPTILGIVEAHGGRMRVDTELGVGSRFTVALPADPGARVAAAADTPAREAFRGRGLALLADDEAAVRGIVHRILARTGYEVVEARDGAEAVQRFRESRARITLAVLDATMPGLDGFAALRTLRGEAPSLPVVLMSGFEETTASGLDADPHTRFLHKPFRPDALIEKVREATEAPASGGHTARRS